MIDRAHRDIRKPCQTPCQEAQSHALAGTRVTMDHRKAPLADLSLLDPPTKILDPGRHVDRLGGQFGGEGIPLQPIQGEEFLVHAGS
ncbi:MAG: hypothetical protein AW07_00278 [Candidatus Accumulibacter sp. SK-11]|nr:MAG: hypothetical protein AW07_00278 [Candidatus Accumulibacter sp. SK-11]